MQQQEGSKREEGGKRVPVEQAMQLAWQHYHAGRYKPAENITRQIVERQPWNVDAVQLLGVLAYHAGNIDEAIQMTEKAADLAPNNASFHSNLCEMYRQKGDLERSTAAGARALEIDPRNGQALNNLGITEFERRDFAAAEGLYRRALEVRPNFPEALNNLGNALKAQGRTEEALAFYQEALNKRPNYAEAHNNYGAALRVLQRYDEAEAAFRKAVLCKANYVEAYNNLALTLWDKERVDEALSILSRSMALQPDRVEPLVLMATLLLEQGKPQGALAAAQKVLKIKPDHLQALNLLGRVHRDLEDLDKSIEVCRRALAIKPDFPEALNNLGISLMEIGDLKGAEEALTKAKAQQPDSLRTLINLASAKKFKEGDPDIAKLEEAHKRISTMAEEQQMSLHYALGKAFDDVKRYQEAFEQFIAGARLKRKTLKYDEGATLRLFDRIRQVFTPKLLQEKLGLTSHSGDNLIFIVGMPRSGSTLTEQIIASHPQVYGAGEIKLLHQSVQSVDQAFGGNVRYPELMHLMEKGEIDQLAKHYLTHLPKAPDGKTHFTDKMLTNYYYVGLIHLAFPEARIIHTRRHPADTCISCYSKLFREDMPYTYDLQEVARYYRRYNELMSYWHRLLPPGRIYDVHYELVVQDLEGEARKLLDYCRLGWDERVLEFHKTERPVKTASVTQVRQPIYSSSTERWRNYGPLVDPLIKELGPLANYRPGVASPAVADEGIRVG
ncbi:MAG TPA: tetratricopeptide repeat protein [Kiloniellales bacterium]|nr:tetratricopeptide repeat protein [Kiloniellales bacterium]